MFDLEGTLVQSIESDQKAIREFRKKTREKLVEIGLPQDELKDHTSSTLMINKAIDYVEEHFSKREVKRFHLKIDHFLKQIQLSWAEQTKIFPETFSALNKFRELGYKMGMVTNTSREAANHILTTHGIDGFFEVVITREDVRKLKPDPEGILLALKKLDARDFFFIGDLIYDSQAAANAGGKSIIVFRNTRRELEFHADHVVNSLKDIPELVQRFSGRVHS